MSNQTQVVLNFDQATALIAEKRAAGQPCKLVKAEGGFVVEMLGGTYRPVNQRSPKPSAYGATFKELSDAEKAIATLRKNDIACKLRRVDGGYEVTSTYADAIRILTGEKKYIQLMIANAGGIYIKKGYGDYEPVDLSKVDPVYIQHDQVFEWCQDQIAKAGYIKLDKNLMSNGDQVWVYEK